MGGGAYLLWLRPTASHCVGVSDPRRGGSPPSPRSGGPHFVGGGGSLRSPKGRATLRSGGPPLRLRRGGSLRSPKGRATRRGAGYYSTPEAPKGRRFIKGYPQRGKS